MTTSFQATVTVRCLHCIFMHVNFVLCAKLIQLQHSTMAISFITLHNLFQIQRIQVTSAQHFLLHTNCFHLVTTSQLCRPKVL